MGNKEFLQIISILLQYPHKKLSDEQTEEVLVAAESKEFSREIASFLEYFNSFPLEELQEKYVQTFDFNEKANLYLTYSKLKEERERGQILVKLKGIYRDEGFVIDSDELPDYLPLFLEFVAIAKVDTVTQLIPQFISIMKELRNQLSAISSPYSDLLAACVIIFEELSFQKGGVQ